MIVTIDGYAGSGKSTAAARLAAALGFHLLNTGAMYRAVGVLLPRHGIDIFADSRDVEHVGRSVRAWTFEMPEDAVLVNGEDVTALTRTEDAGRAASRVGTFPEVREHLKSEQRRLAAGRDIVCEGRDQGTAVFPNAPVKFFFRASVETRAERRVKELQAAVGAYPFEPRPGVRVYLSISAGVARFPVDGDTFQELLAAADERMYRDKATRRSRSSVRQPVLVQNRA